MVDMLTSPCPCTLRYSLRMSQQFTEKGRLFGFPKGERHVHGQKRKSLTVVSRQCGARLGAWRRVRLGAIPKSRTVALCAGRTKSSFESSKKYRVAQTFHLSSLKSRSGFFVEGPGPVWVLKDERTSMSPNLAHCLFGSQLTQL